MSDVKDAKLRYSDTVGKRRELLKADILCDYRRRLINRARARRLLRHIGFDYPNLSVLLDEANDDRTSGGN